MTCSSLPGSRVSGVGVGVTPGGWGRDDTVDSEVGGKEEFDAWDTVWQDNDLDGSIALG